MKHIFLKNDKEINAESDKVASIKIDVSEIEYNESIERKKRNSTLIDAGS